MDYLIVIGPSCRFFRLDLSSLCPLIRKLKSKAGSFDHCPAVSRRLMRLNQGACLMAPISGFFRFHGSHCAASNIFPPRTQYCAIIFIQNSSTQPHFFGDLCQCKNYAPVNFKHQPLMSICKSSTIIIVHHSLKTSLLIGQGMRIVR